MIRYSCAVLMVIAAVASAYGGDTLEEYAQKCDQAIGVTVPDFDCDSGTLVPTTHFANGKCDRPNVLNRECDPGSRFQVLTNNADAYVVAHCRKRGLSAGHYHDIAVIQHNRNNGATCFYQALGDHDGRVKAPSKGTSAWPWYTPAATAAIGCAGCHDNGPLIRSPYLTQITGPNQLPGAGDASFNYDEPYFFVGEDFASWRAYKVEVAGNTCNICHRMGVNNVRPGLGTALDLGIRATAPSQAAKNPHSLDSPIWMLPGQITYLQASANAAQAIKDCASRLYEKLLPNSPSCKITPYASQYIGGTLQTASSWGPNRLDVFGLHPNGDVLQLWWDGANWHWSNLGNGFAGDQFIGPITAASWGEGRYDVFGLGTNGDVLQLWFDGANWHWSNLGNGFAGDQFIGPITAASWGEGRYDVFGLGANDDVLQLWFDGANWHWSNLGGVP